MSTPQVDLEQGRATYQHQHHHRTSSGSDDEEDSRSICFSDADEGSCYSTFYSTVGESYETIRLNDHEVGDGSMSRRDSCVSDCSVEVVIQEEDGDVKVHLDEEVGDESRECRICHLSLGSGSNVIELGCDCKNDLAVAHFSCAEKWFKIRGNRLGSQSLIG